MTDIADVLESITRQLVVLKELLTQAPHARDDALDERSPSIAAQIVAWRQSHDWTQEELAVALGTSQAVISRFEDPEDTGHSLRSLRRLAEVFGAELVVRLAPGHCRTSGWQSIDTAPKDGRAILLLSKPDDMDIGLNGLVQRPPQVAIGYWEPTGTAWVDEMGRLDGEAYQLAVTGVWFSKHGWFQPNEVTHWRPLPEPPERSGDLI